MGRLLVHVEGETEEAFVNEVLRRHLQQKGYERVSARLMGNARQRDRRGGIRSWQSAKKDIVRHLKEDRTCVATTMVDYYGLPGAGDRAWPGRAQAAALPAGNKGAAVESALLAEIRQEMGPDFDARRFVPFVVVHEFEGLLFSDCEAFARVIGGVAIGGELQRIRDQFASPEEINDSPTTAPSKRIQSLFPSYQKPLHGNVAALEIGLEQIRVACPHFRDWLTRLESLVG